MLRWADVRRLVAPDIGVPFLRLGFKNPGRMMWRVRPPFVDVVSFRSDKYGQSLAIELGCGLRRFIQNNPAPWECQFRVHPVRQLGWDRDVLDFHDSVPAQHAAFVELTPPLLTFAES